MRLQLTLRDHCRLSVQFVDSRILSLEYLSIKKPYGVFQMFANKVLRQIPEAKEGEVSVQFRIQDIVKNLVIYADNVKLR